MAKKRRQQNKTGPHRLWPLLAVNFFMADMQSGIGPFVGVFLLERGWASGMIGTALAIGNIAGPADRHARSAASSTRRRTSAPG